MHEITNFVLILDFLSPNKLFCFSSVFDFVRLYRRLPNWGWNMATAKQTILYNPIRFWVKEGHFVASDTFHC